MSLSSQNGARGRPWKETTSDIRTNLYQHTNDKAGRGAFVGCVRHPGPKQIYSERGCLNTVVFPSRLLHSG